MSTGSSNVGHLTIFCSMITILHAVLVVGLALGLRLDLVSGWLVHVYAHLNMYTILHCYCHSPGFTRSSVFHFGEAKIFRPYRKFAL